LQADTAYLRNHSTDKKPTTMEVTNCKKAVHVLWVIILSYKLPIDQAFLTNPCCFKRSCYSHVGFVKIILVANFEDLLDASDHARLKDFSFLSQQFLFRVKIYHSISSYPNQVFRYVTLELKCRLVPIFL